MASRARYAATLVVLLFLACLSDPISPGVLTVSLAGGSADTVWLGAPGETLPSEVRVIVTDGAGHSISAAALTWETAGTGSSVTNASAVTDAAGQGVATWRLGTNAFDEQRLRVTVQTQHSGAEMLLRARAIPHVVRAIRVVGDTPTVVRVGDTLELQVHAIDPYGNEFSAPDLMTGVEDSTMGTSVGAEVVGGPRRGRSIIQIGSHGVATTLPLHVTQFVSSIVPAFDTVVFSSLGADLPVSYVVRDDRGRPILDTVATISTSDTTVVRMEGTRLRSLAPGEATLRFELGSAVATVPVAVDQRIASLVLNRDTILFDALLDTTTIRPIAHDSLGFAVLQPSVVIEVQDGQVAELSDGSRIRAVRPGVTMVTVRDPETGVMTSATVVVRQVVRSIIASDIAFDALGDTVTPMINPLDRLGSTIVGAQLLYEIADSTVANWAGGQIRSVGQGITRLVVRDMETGTTGAVSVDVHQRLTSLSMDVDALSFDALLDTVPLHVVGRDRLGSLIADVAARISYSSTNPQVIAVSDEGVAHSFGNGSALLVAQSSDGPSDTVVVSVSQVAESIAVRVEPPQGILTVSYGGTLPLTCKAYDRNGWETPDEPLMVPAGGTVNPGRCSQATAQASGHDTLQFSVGRANARLPVVLAVAPVLDAPTGRPVVFNELLPNHYRWTPSARRRSTGQVELYLTQYPYPTSGMPRGDLHRFVSSDGLSFRYDGVALAHGEDPCGPDGSGIENIVIAPRADGAGWRMFYAAGSWGCYGWQVFSATSTDERTWTKEPGIRLSNGGDLFSPPVPPEHVPWPVGEGMVIDRLPSGQWRIITASFEHVLFPAPDSHWEISEWTSDDQLSWTYDGMILPTSQMPEAAQGSVYSPTIIEVVPGLYRMFFTGDNRRLSSNPRSALWSAVSTDRRTWQIEDQLIGSPGTDVYYATLVDDKLYFLTNITGSWSPEVRVAVVSMR